MKRCLDYNTLTIMCNRLIYCYTIAQLGPFGMWMMLLTWDSNGELHTCIQDLINTTST